MPTGKYAQLLDFDGFIEERDYINYVNCNNFSDEQYAKVYAFRERCIKERKFYSYILNVSEPFRLKAFVGIEQELKDVEFWTLLRDTWIMYELVYIEELIWMRLFTSKRGERDLLMTPLARRTFQRFPDMLTVWRGCDRNFIKSGLSWTLNRKVAQKFAHGMASLTRTKIDGVLLTGKCKKTDIFAYFTDRKESEIIVESAKVKRKRIVELE